LANRKGGYIPKTTPATSHNTDERTINMMLRISMLRLAFVAADPAGFDDISTGAKTRAVNILVINLSDLLSGLFILQDNNIAAL